MLKAGVYTNQSIPLVTFSSNFTHFTHHIFTPLVSFDAAALSLLVYIFTKWIYLSKQDAACMYSSLNRALFYLASVR